MLIHRGTWTALRDLVKNDYLIKNVFTALQKLEQLAIMVENGHISINDYLTCKKNGMNLT